MNKLIQELGDFVFKRDLPQKADIIFVTGGSFPEQGEYSAQLYKAGYAPLILPSGKYSVHNGRFNGALSKRELYPYDCATESEFLSRVLQQNGVPQSAIICEQEAVSTYDNARFSRALLQARGIEISKGIVCCKSMHARRAYMYYQYYFKDADILVCPVDIAGVTADNWYTSAEGVGIVMSELEKCGKQFAPMLSRNISQNASEAPDLLQFF